MVTKGKLKVALDAERKVDYKQKHQDKMVKKARRQKNTSAGKQTEEGWEDVASDDEMADDIAAIEADLEEEGSNDGMLGNVSFLQEA